MRRMSDQHDLLMIVCDLYAPRFFLPFKGRIEVGMGLLRLTHGPHPHLGRPLEGEGNKPAKWEGISRSRESVYGS
jgi:hypothetical protein